jgi:transposase
MQIDVLGIDLAKRVFQLHGATRNGVVVHRSKVSRPGLMQAILRLQPRLVVMEACGSAHHWARQLQARGIEVRLITPQFVAPFVKTNTHDRNDAEAIVEASSRPTMRFVAVKSVEQQDIQALHRLRQLFVHQRTAVINHVRGILAERGVVVAKSPPAFHRAMPGVLATEGGELTATCRELLIESLQHLDVVERRIHEADARVKRLMSGCELCRKIGAIEGIGPLTATAVVAAVGDASAFKNGRHLAAWLGLVPRQHSSGGRSRLHGISKRGDAYLRTLLIHGARSVLRWVGEKQDAHSRWLRDLIERRGYNRAAVALANKNARVIQAMLSSERVYRPPRSPAEVPA